MARYTLRLTVDVTLECEQADLPALDCNLLEAGAALGPTLTDGTNAQVIIVQPHVENL